MRSSLLAIAGPNLDGQHMRVQMIDDQRIRVEVFAPASTPFADFTAGAKVFVR